MLRGLRRAYLAVKREAGFKKDQTVSTDSLQYAVAGRTAGGWDSREGCEPNSPYFVTESAIRRGNPAISSHRPSRSSSERSRDRSRWLNNSTEMMSRKIAQSVAIMFVNLSRF